MEEVKKKSVTSPVLQEIISKNVKIVDAPKGKPIRSNKVVVGPTECTTKKGKNKKRNSNKHSGNKLDNEKSSSVPPSEEIPKFEHINKWLNDAQEPSIIELTSDSSFNSPEKVSKPTKPKSKGLKSLSPRIKKKIQIAQSTLQEEQQIFEELYGSDLAKRYVFYCL